MDQIARLMTVATFVALSVGTSVASAQDRAQVVPDMQILLENACVRVQYHDVAVGETTPMHSHPNYIVYRFKPTKARITLADGSQRTGERKAGEVTWEKATTHSVENLGDTDIHNLIVELKPEASCD